MTKRRRVSLPDDADELLQALMADCGMDLSQTITQLIRRYHPDLRELFAAPGVSNRNQSCAGVSNRNQSCADVSNRNQSCADVSKPTQVSPPLATTDPSWPQLATTDPSWPQLATTDPPVAKPDPKQVPELPQQPTPAKPIAELPAEELARLRALKPIERMKYFDRIKHLKSIVEPQEDR